jgi:hypothetical protein
LAKGKERGEMGKAPTPLAFQSRKKKGKEEKQGEGAGRERRGGMK